MAPFTLLVSGPIKSRFGNEITLLSLINAFLFIKRLSPENQIILSTYEDEVPLELEKYVDKIILNSDPGADHFRVNPWPIGNGLRNQSANISRMLRSTVSGLEQTQSTFVIKTRVELIPADYSKFVFWLDDISENILQSNAPLIGFFLQHYSGITFSVNGILGMIPDTLQYGRTETLRNLWVSSEKFWQQNFNVITRSRIRFPITSEQVLGVNYLHLFCDFPLSDELGKLRRNYKSVKLIRALIVAERDYFKWSSYKTSGLSANYLRGTLNININRFKYLDSISVILKMLCVVYLKSIYHHFRRYLLGFQNLAKNR